MPPRDPDEYEGRRQQIIEGALQVFAYKGFEKATNKDIADAANIGSPGLIYHYFKDKADLLREVVESRAEAIRLLAHAEALLERPPREVLQIIGDTFVRTAAAPGTVPLIKVMFGEALRRPALAALVNSIGPGPVIGFLTRYLEHQMALGNLRRADARAAARAFVGPLLVYMVTREVFAQQDALDLPPETMVATTIDVFLNGLQPPAPPG
jgi:AcrR family transcriptional regulator